MRPLLSLFVLLLVGPATPAGPAGRFQPDPKLPPDAGVPYVIITNDALAPSFQRLVDWKRSTGLAAQVVSVDWLAKSPYYPGIDLPERIYHLIRDLRMNWRTRWIVLGGGVEIIPQQRIRAFHGEFGGNQVACDVYYSDVLPEDRTDGDAVEQYGWNGNGDRFVGDAEKDTFDLVPDLFLGRIPVEDPKEANAFLDKYFEYVTPAKETAWLNRALVVGAGQFRENQENVSKLFRELGGSTYSTELLVEKAPDPIQAITDEMNKGYGFFDFLCHGCPAHFWAKDDHTSWGITQVRTLKNEGHYPIVFANSCDTAEFDKANCLAVGFLTQPKAGAIAYMGYTQVCFQSPVNQEMYRLLFSGKCPQLGRALTEAKNKFAQDKWVGQVLHLFGDPEMWARTSAPAAPKITEECLALNQPGRVKVTDAAGKPLAARVLVEAAGLYLSAETDENGIAHLAPPSKPGAVKISVMTQNGGRVEKKATIDAKPNGPAFPRPVLTVDDEAGNKQKDLNPGETVKFVFAFPKDATPGLGKWDLSFIDNPYVKTTGGGAIDSSGTLAFNVAASAKSPPWTQAWCTLSFTPDSGDPWVWTFRQPVEGPSISCVSCIVDDSDGNKDKRVGWEDAGKKIRFSVGLLNHGTQKANNLKLTIATEEPSVTLTRATVNFGTLVCEDALHPKDKTFEFQLAADYDGHPVAFTMTIEDERGSKWIGRIVFTVPPAPPLLVKAEGSLKSIALTWLPSGSPGVVGYHVYRGTSEKGPFTKITEQPIRGGTRYPDQGLKPMSCFFYVVTSATADGLESRFSAPARGHTLTPLPKMPAGAEK